jgi:hypothetical protein
MGGWKTAAMFRRYAIVSSADQRAAVEMLELARAKAAERQEAEQATGADMLSRAQVTGRPV